MFSNHNATKLAKIVRTHMDKNDLSVRSFARTSELSSSHVQNIRQGDLGDIKISTLSKLSKAMSITLSDLLLKIDLINEPHDYVFSVVFSKVVPTKHKKFFEENGELIIQIAEKIALSDIGIESFRKIVDAVAEIKK